MRRILLICHLLSPFALPAAAQTLEGSSVISLSLTPAPPTCSISSTAPTINFGTFTSNPPSEVSVSADAFAIAFTGTNGHRISASLGSGSMSASGGTSIPYRVTLSCPGSEGDGCPGRAGSFTTSRTCNCSISATATIPAAAPAGSYSGTSTLTVTCGT